MKPEEIIEELEKARLTRYVLVKGKQGFFFLPHATGKQINQILAKNL